MVQGDTANQFVTKTKHAGALAAFKSLLFCCKIVAAGLLHLQLIEIYRKVNETVRISRGAEQFDDAVAAR